MARELLHIYGPFSIQSFGLAIAAAIAVFTVLVLRDPKRPHIISQDAFVDLLMIGSCVGFLGARLLYIFGEWHSLSLIDMLSIWNGGFSFLGGAISVTLIMPWYIKKQGIPFLPFADLVCLYMPLLQSIARLGCLAAGCCFGQASTLPWAITYTDPDSFAPCHIPLHPTQLYSSIGLLIIFLALYYGAQRICSKPGQIAGLYFIGIGIERCMVDFWRADHEYLANIEILSLHQILAVSLVVFGLCFFMYSSFLSGQKHNKAL